MKRRTTMESISLLLWLILSISGRVHGKSNAILHDEMMIAQQDIASLPFPGIRWYQRIATDDTVYLHTVARDNAEKDSEPIETISYTSVYDAIVYGSPIDHSCRNFNSYINSFLFGPQSAAWIVRNLAGNNLEVGHYLLCYLRNLILGVLIYYATAAIFHYHLYIHPRSKEIFRNRPRPSNAMIWDQIKLSQASLFIYTMLPVMDELLIESGATMVYYTMNDAGGLLPHFLYTIVYFACVEVGIYWMHRWLHENKFMYKYVHGIHHKYNTPDALTPWASIAFHPLDGMLQACPYVICTLIVPVHYLTHLVMVFFTAIWATYIHDAMDWNVHPIMGSKYHTVHHTHYLYNYGQVFVFCDILFGTLKEPDGPIGRRYSETKKSN